MSEQPAVPQGQNVAPSGPGDGVSDQTDRALATRRAARVAEPPPDWMTPRVDAAPPGAVVPAAVAPGAVAPGAAGAPVGEPAVPGPVPSDLLAPVDPSDADLFEDGWSAPRRTSRLTAIMVTGIVAAAGFAGGTYVQRNHDQGLIPTAAAAGAGARAGFGAGGFAPGGFGAGGFGGTGAGTGTGRSTSSAGTGTGSGGTGSGAAVNKTPVVVGSVASVDATSLTVKNFGGASIVVHLSDTTTVTTAGIGGLKAGATVAVFGTKAADGSVTAISIVSRKAG